MASFEALVEFDAVDRRSTMLVSCAAVLCEKGEGGVLVASLGSGEGDGESEELRSSERRFSGSEFTAEESIGVCSV